MMASLAGAVSLTTSPRGPARPFFPISGWPRVYREEGRPFQAARVSQGLEGECTAGPWWEGESQSRGKRMGDGFLTEVTRPQR